MGDGTGGADLHVRTTVGRAAGESVSLTYVGVAEGLRYVEPWVAHRFFDTPGHCEQGRGTFSAAGHPEGDLLLVAAPERELDALALPGGWRMPFRVHLVADLAPDSPDAASATFRRQVQRHARRVDRYGLRFEFSDDEADYHWFYEHMYEPTMRTRHGGLARAVDRETGRDEILRAGNQLFVVAAGRRVAGIVSQVDRSRRRVSVRLVGWLGAEDRYLRAEVLKSGYLHLREWAADAGFAALDFMGCEPFVSKGTFQSKRRLGTHVEYPPGDLGELRLHLAVRRDGPAVRAFLTANPLLTTGPGNTMGVTYFHDVTRPPPPELPYACGGLDFRHDVPLGGREPA
ncbi:hypothetical protein AB0H63_13110 [Micromonospora echinospora]|uniref:hypothetical protein n=1 Tax=Micromonospora echinospora TaxID=1877 RepID=UPI0033F5A34E